MKEKDKKQKKFYLDKNYICDNILYRYKSVSRFTKELKISRVRFYQIINATYTKKSSPSVDRIIRALDLCPALTWVEDDE